MLFVLTLVGAVLALVVWRGVRRVNPQAGFAVGGVAALLAAIALAQTVRVVPAGHVGVVDLFGRVDSATRKSGLNIVNPFARVISMSVKTQELKEVMDVPSREGLTMQLEASALFHLDPEKAAEVYKSVGPDYVSVLLEPQFRSVTRGVTSQYEARALYTSERELLKWKGIEATQKLAESQNSKVVIVGSGKDGLPVILGGN